MTLLLTPRGTPVAKTRNRTGIANIFKRAMERGERVTLEQAIAILKAGW